MSPVEVVFVALAAAAAALPVCAVEVYLRGNSGREQVEAFGQWWAAWRAERRRAGGGKHRRVRF